jgi:hypothetical protein
VASAVSWRPKTRGSRGEERQLSLPLLARLLEILN